MIRKCILCSISVVDGHVKTIMLLSFEHRRAYACHVPVPCQSVIGRIPGGERGNVISSQCSA